METTNNTTEKIIAAIDRQKVTPRPAWYFAVRNSVLWIPGVVTTLLGAYTIAGVLYAILHAHWENRQYIQTGPLVFIAIIPLLWVISFCLFLIITVSLLQKTNTGYRHTALQLLSISVAGSIVIGVLFYAFTASSLTDSAATYYRHPTQHEQEYVWNNPEDGRISGVITGTIGPATLAVTNFNGFVWTVDISALPADTSSLSLQTGNAIRIIGAITSNHSFMACRVLPWELFLAQSSPVPSFIVPARPSTCDEILHNVTGK